MEKVQAPPAYDQFRDQHAVQAHSLTEDQIGLLHAASLEVLARTGARFHAPAALGPVPQGRGSRLRRQPGTDTVSPGRMGTARRTQEYHHF